MSKQTHKDLVDAMAQEILGKIHENALDYNPPNASHRSAFITAVKQCASIVREVTEQTQEVLDNLEFVGE